MMSSSSSRKRQKRWTPKVRTGCQTCRRRRIKCGEERPTCQRCLKADVACEGYEEAPSDRFFFSIGELRQVDSHHSERYASLQHSFPKAKKEEEDEEKINLDDLDPQPDIDEEIQIPIRSARSPTKTHAQIEDQPHSNNVSISFQHQRTDAVGTHLGNYSTLIRQPQSAIDSFRSLTSTEIGHTHRLLTFWHIWTRGAPEAHDVLRICIRHEAALSSLLAANALFMELLGLDLEGDRKYRRLTYRSIRFARTQSATDSAFLSTDVGLTALLWLITASWFAGEIEATRMHLYGFKASLENSERQLEDLPVYLRQIVVYIDFMLAMTSLTSPIIAIVPDSLCTHIPRAAPGGEDAILHSYTKSFLVQFNAISASLGSNFAPLLEQVEAFTHLTFLHLDVASGRLPMSYFPPMSYTNWRDMSKVLAFAFKSTETEEDRKAARVGMIMVVWCYCLVLVYGIVHNGGCFPYPDAILKRFPRHKTPEVYETCLSLNNLFRRLKKGMTTLSPRVTPLMIYSELGRLGKLLCGRELSDLTVVLQRYMDLARVSFDAEDIMRKEAQNFDIGRRIRFLGPLIASDAHISASLLTTDDSNSESSPSDV